MVWWAGDVENLKLLLNNGVDAPPALSPSLSLLAGKPSPGSQVQAKPGKPTPWRPEICLPGGRGGGGRETLILRYQGGRAIPVGGFAGHRDLRGATGITPRSRRMHRRKSRRKSSQRRVLCRSRASTHQEPRRAGREGRRAARSHWVHACPLQNNGRHLSRGMAR